MSDYDRNARDPRLADPAVGDPVLESSRPTYTDGTLRNSTPSWIGGIIVAILVIAGAAWFFSRSTTGNNTVEHRASATDTAAPSAPVASPAPAAPAPAPSTQPK